MVYNHITFYQIMQLLHFINIFHPLYKKLRIFYLYNAFGSALLYTLNKAYFMVEQDLVVPCSIGLQWHNVF